MSTATTSVSQNAPATNRTARGGSSFKRVSSLAAFELRMLSRNSVAMFTALFMPAATVLVMTQFLDTQGAPGAFTSQIIIFNTTFALLFAVFYNQTAAVVARREELMLKRWLTGSCSSTEILIAMAIPPMVVAVGQSILTAVVASFAFGMAPLTNPALALLALVAGSVICVLLSYTCSGTTKTVDGAQLTTLPYILALLFLSSAVFPLPDNSTVAFFFQASPLWGTVELLKLGVGGVSFEAGQVDFAESWLRAIFPSFNIAFWFAAGVALVKRYMVWEPRR